MTYCLTYTFMFSKRLDHGSFMPLHLRQFYLCSILSTTQHHASALEPLEGAEWKVCTQTQGNWYLPLAYSCYFVFTPQNWASSRHTLVTKQYTSRLSNEGFRSIPGQAVLQVLDTRGCLCTPYCQYSHHAFQNPSIPPWVTDPTGYIRLSTKARKLHTFRWLCTDVRTLFGSNSRFYR
jgi:hypothetical protein